MLMPAEVQAQDTWLKIDTRATILFEGSATEEGFTPAPKSPLAGDDIHSQDYQVSHALRMKIISAADHLHAMCALVLHTERDRCVQHQAPPHTRATV